MPVPRETARPSTSAFSSDRRSSSGPIPDWVLLQLGTNDLRIDSHATTTAQFRNNLEAILDRIGRHRNPDGSSPRIILATIPPIPVEVRWHFDAGSRARVEAEINPAIRDIARRRGLILADLHPLFVDRPELLPEIHPSEEGYRALAEAWQRILAPLLSSAAKAGEQNAVNSIPETKRLAGRSRRSSLAAFVIPAAVSIIIVWLLLRGISWQRLAGQHSLRFALGIGPVCLDRTGEPLAQGAPFPGRAARAQAGRWPCFSGDPCPECSRRPGPGQAGIARFLCLAAEAAPGGGGRSGRGDIHRLVRPRPGHPRALPGRCRRLALRPCQAGGVVAIPPGMARRFRGRFLRGLAGRGLVARPLDSPARTFFASHGARKNGGRLGAGRGVHGTLGNRHGCRPPRRDAGPSPGHFAGHPFRQIRVAVRVDRKPDGRGRATRRCTWTSGT